MRSCFLRFLGLGVQMGVSMGFWGWFAFGSPPQNPILTPICTPPPENGENAICFLFLEKSPYNVNKDHSPMEKSHQSHPGMKNTTSQKFNTENIYLPFQDLDMLLSVIMKMSLKNQIVKDWHYWQKNYQPLISMKYFIRNLFNVDIGISLMNLMPKMTWVKKYMLIKSRQNYLSGIQKIWI